MRSALFVDFDKVCSGLRRLDPSIAEPFVRGPAAGAATPDGMAA